MSTTVVYSGKHDIVSDTRRDGYFCLDDFLNKEAVRQARNEMVILLEQDLARREISGSKAPVTLITDGYKTTNTDLMHTRLFPSCESPTFAKIVSDILTFPLIEDFMRRVIGEHYRLRVDLIRRASGKNDNVDGFQLPHVWHRDTPGEFTFGVFFDDMYEIGSGCTAVIPGTHWERRDPRWDLMLSAGSFTNREQLTKRQLVKIPDRYNRYAFFNSLVRAKLKRRAREISGGIGGIYFFFNDTWHGRAPNTSGNQHMLARFGGFPTDFEFKDDIPLPDTIRNLPSSLCDRYAVDQPANVHKDTLVQEIQHRRGYAPLRYLAQHEKALIVRRAINAA
ncbi:MAG: phytanoyl-CoA dioxygenase family protein [Pseudomonadales bacterium]